jgi:hypothetical protein
MTLTNQTKQHVIARYVAPARQRGQSTIQVRVGNVLKELGWTNRTPSVFSTLSSRHFLREAGLELVEKRGGPSSGGPSTTVEFVYRIVDENSRHGAPTRAASDGIDLAALYGIGAKVYRELGGGEEYMKRERDALRFPAEGAPRTREQA